jgi:putative nucleotidyltransferase with HDIG domain
MMNLEEAELKTMAAVIGSDPSLSALVLRLANSPLFGVRYPVTGILQAVALLGLNRLRVLASTAALRIHVGTGLAMPAVTNCWRHSVACALATQEIAVSSSFDGDVAYTAGLLHDIGCFAALGCWPREYSQLLATCRHADLLKREVELLGVSHTDAGAFLLQHWGLPSTLVEVARKHHCSPLERKSRLVELVSHGCRLADAIGFAVTGKTPGDRAADAMVSNLVDDQDAFYFRICDGINQIEYF